MANLGYVQVTRECNQHCLFCSNPPIEERQTYERVCSRIDDLKERGFHGVILTGGEPSLCPFLSSAVEYANGLGLPVRIISNGQKLADPGFLQDLVDAGLSHVHVSLHSHRAETQACITQNKDSLANIERALENIGGMKINVDINTVICRPNANHLQETVEWVVDRFPGIGHFVFNNIDPMMNRCEENPGVIPTLGEIELGLNRAMCFLVAKGKSFRVERVPLCYMAEFAEFSTETRKIVKQEERVVHFLDQCKGTVRQTSFVHGKADVCSACSLDPVCAGLYSMDEHFSSSELYPVFLNPDSIAKKVLSPKKSNSA